MQKLQDAASAAAMAAFAAAMASCSLAPGGESQSSPPQARASQVTVKTRPCDAGPARHHLGRIMNAGLRKSLAEGSGAMDVRVVRRGSEMTLEFSATRLTVVIDRSGRVADLWCG